MSGKRDAYPPMRGESPYNHIPVSLSLPRELLREIDTEARAKGQTRFAYVAFLLHTHRKRRRDLREGEQ